MCTLDQEPPLKTQNRVLLVVWEMCPGHAHDVDDKRGSPDLPTFDDLLIRLWLQESPVPREVMSPGFKAIKAPKL
jgi:hypothetical protein